MKIRIFQIDHQKDEKNLAFRDYQTAIARNGRIDESIYKQVYGGEVPCKWSDVNKVDRKKLRTR